ncbi:MAG: AI-2E family transporter [Tatlockia sp.]|nr:AI-2E family transporter [Tatlockia sp.]
MKTATSNWELKTLVFIAVITAIKFSQLILFPLLFSFFLYLLFNPIVEWLVKFKIPRALAATLIVISLLGLLSLAISSLVQPASEWIEEAPAKFHIVEQKFHFLKESLGQINKAAETAQSITDTPKKNEVKIATPGLDLGSSLFDLTSNILILIISVAILLFFLLLYFKSFIQNLEKILYNKRRISKENDFLLCLKNEVSHYMLVFSLICAGLGVTVACCFALLGFPNPILWGAMAMFLTYVPYVGHLIGIIIISFISIITFNSYFYIFAPPLVYFLLSALEGQVITPILLGNRLDLNPFIILINIFIWSWLWGISGIVISVPLLVMFKITLERTPGLAKYSLLLEK